MSTTSIQKRAWLSAAIIVGVILVDQWIKIWVKTSMTLHEQIEILPWFRIVFIENNGMAYGMEIGSKLLLSVFRIVAVCALSWYICRQVVRQARTGYLVCLSLVVAGAAGNIIDSMFYGLVFSASTDYYVSYTVPFGTGYAPFLMGKVVDMFYFPLIVTTWPEWVPFVGGGPFVFFSPIFNFADSAISVGVVLLLLFYRKEIGAMKFGKQEETDETT